MLHGAVDRIVVAANLMNITDIVTVIDRSSLVRYCGYASSNMESFRPPAPLRLAYSNLETEWASFEMKFRWFLIAIGANEKPDATKLVMLLSTVGDDAVKAFEAFAYQEGESCDTFDVVIRKFKE